MSNSTRPLLYGLLTPAHTSNLTAIYPPSNLPTPWPLVLANFLLSLVLGTIGFIEAANSWNSNAKQKEIADQKGMTWMEKFRVNQKRFKEQEREWGVESELEDLNNGPNNTIRTPARSTWQNVKLYGTFTWSSLRAVLALVLSLTVAATGHGSQAAPSSLFVLLLSVQTFLSNRTMPRIFNIVLVVDSLFVAVAFLLASFDHQSGAVSYYGQLAISGGNCPIYAPNCAAEARSWDEVGCGLYDTRSKNPYANGFRPYGSTGDLNSGANVVHIIEVVISIFGAIWMITVALTIYEARHLVTHSLRDLGLPVERYIRGKTKGMGFALTVVISVFAWLGMIAVGILAIAGHLSQALHSHTGDYIDSFGPRVQVFNDNGALMPGFLDGGNATSWTDCFTITTPVSGDGFWDQWWDENVQTGYRIVAGL